MNKYPITLNNGSIAYVSQIGVNHLSNGGFLGGTASSYGECFTNDDLVSVEMGFGDIRYCTIGDISEAYQYLKEEIMAKKPQTLESYCECIEQVVLRYFGNFSSVDKRLSFFPSDEDIEYDGKKQGCVSNIAHQNAAMCVERAMLAQNLLIEIGIPSTFKLSGVIVNGNPDAHAFNLIEHEGKYYIFDATIPTVKNSVVSPLICEIPQEVYEKMKRPESYIGYSVEVCHYNPLQQKDYHITYDAGRENVFKVEDETIKEH